MSSSLQCFQVLRNDPDEADKFKEEDSVVINPTEEEIDEQIVKMEGRRARVKAEKKAAKAAKKGIVSAQPASSGSTSAVPANDGFKRPGLPGDIQVSPLLCIFKSYWLWYVGTNLQY